MTFNKVLIISKFEKDAWELQQVSKFWEAEKDDAWLPPG